MEPDRSEGRDFAGNLTELVIRHLQRHAAPGAVAEVLALAEETRSAAALCESTTWSSYTQFRRLLAATATTLGGVEQLEDIGAQLFTELSEHDFIEMLQALGSPAALYAEMESVSATSMPNVAVATDEVGPTEWLIHQQMTNGRQPFRAYCAFGRGLLSVTPRLFGYPLGDVVEDQCQCDGAPRCTFRVRWDDTDGPARKVAYLETRVRVLEGRLEALQRTVGDLVSADDLEQVLSSIVASAARTSHAPSHILVIEALPTAAQRVYAEGIDEAEAQRIAPELLSDAGGAVPGRIVVDVASTRRSYGRLAALDPHGGNLLPQTQVVLEAYGRLAAAALDSATSLQEARRETATAKVLLDLSSSLAEVVSTEEMTRKIVRAVPLVVDCDRVAVFMIDPASRTAKAMALHGFDEDEQRHLLSLVVEVPDRLSPHRYTDEHNPFRDPAAAAAMQTIGDRAFASVPIIWGGDAMGWVAVSVKERPERLQDPEVAERLRGLAGQAATAIRNARLLDQIRHEALHDALTGLPNRALIHDRVHQMLVRDRRHHRPSAVLFIDLDGFKGINDTLGHDVGDQVLQAVASRLTATLRDSDTIGRLGGDEFIALVDGANLDAGPELVADRLLEVLRQPFELDGVTSPLCITASIGIAVGVRDSVGDLLRDADVALYRAKSAGKDCFIVFEPEMQTAVRDRLELEMDLRGALERDEYFLLYQPVYDLQTGRMCGVEALLRWRHPVRGIVQPDTFVPILEETRMIVDVGRWVLDTACHQAVAWHANGQQLGVAVNASARQLDLDTFVDDIRATLQSTGLEPSALTIEITETAIMHDAAATARRLAAIKALGVRVSIDDFGTGQSSLGYLSQFPVDALKIDRFFVAALGSRTDSSALIRTLVQLGKNLGLEIVAEGIETADQAQHLQLENCDLGQGFLFSRPVEATHINDLLRLADNRPDRPQEAAAAG